MGKICWATHNGHVRSFAAANQIASSEMRAWSCMHMKINGKPLYICTCMVLWLRKRSKGSAAASNQGRTQPSARISRSPASNQAHNLPMPVYFRPRSWRSDQSASYCYLITHQNTFSVTSHEQLFLEWDFLDWMWFFGFTCQLSFCRGAPNQGLWILRKNIRFYVCLKRCYSVQSWNIKW